MVLSAARATCLTDAELAQLQAAVPGQAPAALAHHLAECARCQQRVLFGAQPRRPGRQRPLPEWPTPRSALVMLLAVLAALAMLLYSLQRLSGVFR